MAHKAPKIVGAVRLPGTERHLAVPRGSLRVLVVALVVSALSGPVFIAGVWAQPPGAPDASATDEVRADVETIARLFYARRFDAVVREAGPLLGGDGAVLPVEGISPAVDNIDNPSGAAAPWRTTSGAESTR